MQAIKGKTSRKLLMEYGMLRQQFWGRCLWARGYFVATSGTVTDDVIREYIRFQDEPPSEDVDHFIPIPLEFFRGAAKSAPVFR